MQGSNIVDRVVTVKTTERLAKLIALDTTVGSSDPEVQRLKHAEIARRYAWRDQDRLKLTRSQRHMNIRLREIEDFYSFSYGRSLPDDDAGRDDLVIAFHTIAGIGGGVVMHCTSWARMWAPWLPAAEATAIAECVAANPMKFRADTLAWRLGLTAAIRAHLEINTIGAIDLNKEQRAARRKERKRLAEAQRRRAKGAKSRAIYEATSASRAKRWEAAGFNCRRTWERHGRPEPSVASPCPVEEASILSTNLRHSRKRPRPVARDRRMSRLPTPSVTPERAALPSGMPMRAL